MNAMHTHATRPAAGRPAQGRFTLIEVVVALLLIAVLSAMLVPFFGAALTRSGDPALRLPATTTLRTIVERINADYEMNYYDDLATLKTRIEATAGNVYGTFTILQCEYVTFPGGVETGGGTVTDTLKVVLQIQSGERLTALYPYQVEP